MGDRDILLPGQGISSVWVIETSCYPLKASPPCGWKRHPATRSRHLLRVGDRDILLPAQGISSVWVIETSCYPVKASPPCGWKRHPATRSRHLLRVGDRDILLPGQGISSVWVKETSCYPLKASPLSMTMDFGDLPLTRRRDLQTMFLVLLVFGVIMHASIWLKGAASSSNKDAFNGKSQSSLF